MVVKQYIQLEGGAESRVSDNNKCMDDGVGCDNVPQKTQKAPSLSIYNVEHKCKVEQSNNTAVELELHLTRALRCLWMKSSGDLAHLGRMTWFTRSLENCRPTQIKTLGDSKNQR